MFFFFYIVYTDPQGLQHVNYFALPSSNPMTVLLHDNACMYIRTFIFSLSWDQLHYSPIIGVSQLVPSLPVNGSMCPFESAFANRSDVLNNKYTGIFLLYSLVFTACIEYVCIFGKLIILQYLVWMIVHGVVINSQS